MKRLQILLFLCVLLQSILYAQANEKVEDKPPLIYLQPNTTQLFTELYQAYGLLDPPEKTFFESALYLDQLVQPSNQAVFNHASQVLSEFHMRVKDLELYIDPSKPKPLFYTASGSKHLIVALVYGIATSEPNKKFLFVEQAPFYSGHSNAVTGIFNYPNARFVSFHDPAEIHPEPGEILVEFVTSPNNPDGKFRKPLTSAQIIIADFVFASSAFGADGTGEIDKNLEWIKEARAAGKHIFSFNSASKQFGKTGSRCGYIWYPMYDAYASLIFNKFFSFISASTVAGGTTGLANFLDLIKALTALPDSGVSLRADANKSLKQRHILLEKELLHRYPDSITVSIPGSPTLFAKIHDARIPKQKASDVILEDFNIVLNSGESMGETAEFIRVNISGYGQSFAQVLNRLAGQEKYTIQDVLFVTKQECSPAIITGKEQATTLYIAHPGDCFIDADASKGAIEAIFPPFIDYEISKVITIKKTDSSDNYVTIKSEDFIHVLRKAEESVKVQWSQPLYMNGHWQVVK